jgi:hypothetical protein
LYSYLSKPSAISPFADDVRPRPRPQPKTFSLLFLIHSFPVENTSVVKKTKSKRNKTKNHRLAAACSGSSWLSARERATRPLPLLLPQTAAAAPRRRRRPLPGSPWSICGTCRARCGTCIRMAVPLLLLLLPLLL